MRIVIAEDSVLLRAGLTRILADAGEDVVATVGDADELLASCVCHHPDLAIVDVRMPPTHTDDGLRAALADPLASCPASACSCCRSTSRRSTPPSCSAPTRRPSATC